MKIMFNNDDQIYDLYSYNLFEDRLLTISGDFPENTNGLVILDNSGNELKDYSEFTTKYNIYSSVENGYMLSNDGSVEPKPVVMDNTTEEKEEYIPPLTNEELTECVADLMYEMSLTQLGMTGGE